MKEVKSKVIHVSTRVSKRGKPYQLFYIIIWLENGSEKLVKYYNWYGFDEELQA